MVNKPVGPTGYDEYLEEKFKALEDRLTALENKDNKDATSGSTLETMIDLHYSLLKDPHTAEELQTVYLGQVVLMLGAIDDDLKVLRQTLSNMTGIKESKKEGDKKTYEQGANDAWELAKRVIVDTSDGGLSGAELTDIFGESNDYNVFSKYSGIDALKKYEVYEEKKKR